MVRLVEPVLPSDIAVPRIELLAPPTLGFPYLFAGHRFIDGVAADAIRASLLATVARDIGAFLGALHSIPAARGRAVGLREADAAHEAGSREWRKQVLADSQRLRGLDPVVDRALRSLSRAVDREFRARLRWMACLISIFWLDVAHESGRGFAKHLHWVRNVFVRTNIWST